MVSAKYNEVTIFDVKEYAYLCADIYTEYQLLRCEQEILKTLNFVLPVHSSLSDMGDPLPIILYIILHSNRQNMQNGVNRIKHALQHKDSTYGITIASVLEDKQLNLKEILGLSTNFAEPTNGPGLTPPIKKS